jgi:hypothetical protein
VAVPEAGSDEAGEGVAVVVTKDDYIGSEACADCHEDISSRWEKTLHARMLQDPKKSPDAILGDMTQSLPFSEEDIVYTIGNHWTQRYITEIDGEYYVLPRMWSIQSREWMPYSIFSWKRKPWRDFCAGCHTTGYDYETGKFAEIAIGCEACHGPGGKHVDDPEALGSIVNPDKLSKERSLMICESCHVRGRDNGDDEYVFPLNYMPGDDLAAVYTPLDMREGESASRALHRLYDEWKEKVTQPEGTSCELCQNFRGPKKKKAVEKKPEQKKNTHNSSASPDATLICQTCHSSSNSDFREDHAKHAPDVTCTDCHLPSFSKSGESQDIHSHRFQFKTPSKYLAYEECYEPQIQESCPACHSDKSVNWAMKKIAAWDITPYRKLYKVGD